jgi:ATP-dependent DNA helicase RecG
MPSHQNIEHKSNLFNPKSEAIEYKEKLTDSLEKEAVAFLNANGGCIYIGIKDNGDIIGIQNVDKIQLQIKDRLIFGVSPSVLSLISISAENFEKKTVLKITVKEGTEKPYYIKSKGINDESKGIILELIIENPKISVPEIAKMVNLSLSGVEKNIRQLKKDGKLSRTTNTKSGEWIVLE